MFIVLFLNKRQWFKLWNIGSTQLQGGTNLEAKVFFLLVLRDLCRKWLKICLMLKRKMPNNSELWSTFWGLILLFPLRNGPFKNNAFTYTGQGLGGWWKL